MDTTYNIGKLAKLGDVAPSAIRYYERAGLLEPRGRTDGNYRVYGRESLDRLRFIKAAQTAGFTLEDVLTLLAIRDGTQAPCGEVKTLVDRRLKELKQKLQDLQKVQDVLESFVDLCGSSRGDDHCGVLEQLSAASASGP